MTGMRSMSWGLEILTWWEPLVRPGIRKLALQRSKEINRERRGELNLLLTRCLQLWSAAETWRVPISPASNRAVVRERKWEDHPAVKSWWCESTWKVKIYHNDLHKKNLKRSFILKLQTENGLLECHDLCASFLEDQVANLLLHPAPLHQEARDFLLQEVHVVFWEQDNERFMKIHDEKEVKEVLDKSNILAAPVLYISSLLSYHED